MMLGCRRGAEPSTVNGENHSAGSAWMSMSGGRASSASKMSSRRALNFSRGAIQISLEGLSCSIGS